MKIQLPLNVQFIINTLQQHSFEAFIVGGCVRDSLLNRIPNDWDIATNALPQDLLGLFSHTIPTGLKHGTVTVVLNNENFEITTYRIDGTYSDNRRPDEVQFTPLLIEDLSRRDFTINAMAYNKTEGIIDPFNGQQDLENELLVCVGSPSLRFKEDALRMLRAIRFSSQLQFKIAKDTLQAIVDNKNLILNVSQERIREELCKILLSVRPSTGILALSSAGLLGNILPELELCVDFNQHNPHHDKDVFAHTLCVLDNTSNKLEIRLAALFHDIGKPICYTMDEDGIGHFYDHAIESAKLTERILKRLKFDNSTIKKVTILVKEHMSKFDTFKNSTVKKLINRVDVSNLDDLFELQIADIKCSKPPHDFTNMLKLKEQVTTVLSNKEPLSIKDLAIKGSDLIKLGYKPGKDFSIILNKLMEIVLEHPEMNTKEILLANLKNIPLGIHH